MAFGKNLFGALVLYSGMKLHVLWPFAFGLVIMLTMNSCTKTIVQTKTVDSTIVDTSGPALVRFVSMFPDSIATSIDISKVHNGVPTAFTYAVNTMSGSFFPIRPDTSYTFQLSSSTMPGWSASLDVPVLGNSINTFALFLFNNNFVPRRSIDSEYLTPPPLGYCYLRFIDGIADGADNYYLDLDTIYKDLFSNSQPISNLDITRYVLVKAGVHTLFLRTSGSSLTPLQTNPDNLVDGFYYTVRATGSFTDNNAKLTIDQE
jgi:hypothetical protein